MLLSLAAGGHVLCFHSLPVPGATPGLYGLSRGWLCWSSTAAPLQDPLARLSAGAPRGAAPHLWLWWLNPPSGASCPLLSSLSCHQTSDFMVDAVLLKMLFSGAVTRRQGWWVLPRLSGGRWSGISRLRGSVPLHNVCFPDPTFALVADVGTFSTGAEAQGGWRQHPAFPLLLSSCRAVKKALQKNTSNN